MNSLSYYNEIYNILVKLNCKFYYPESKLNNITDFVCAFLCGGFDGKLSHIAKHCHSNKHRTSYGHFLNSNSFKDEYLKKIIQNEALVSMKHSSVSYIVIDDTVCTKSKPSSQAVNPTESAQYHFSHKEHKKVYGHQVFQALIKVDEKVFPYDFSLYNSNSETKSDMAVKIITSLKTDNKSYVLCDSWYTSEKLVSASLQQGHHVIGGLKSNRIIYPNGVNIQIKDFVKFISKSDTGLVTTGNNTYRVYRYEGNLKGIENASVIICWDKNTDDFSKNFRCFLSTDTELTTEEILEHYSNRWAIEVFFRQQKQILSFKKHMLRHKKAIERYWLLCEFSYFIAVYSTGINFVLSFNQFKIRYEESIIEYVYNCALNNYSLEIIKHHLLIL